MQRWVLVVLWHLWVMRAPHDLARKSMNPPENADNDAVSEAAHSETAPTEVHGEPTPKQEPFDIYVHATC